MGMDLSKLSLYFTGNRSFRWYWGAVILPWLLWRSVFALDSNYPWGKKEAPCHVAMANPIGKNKEM